MSALNKAFIRAYTKDAAPRGAAPSASTATPAATAQVAQPTAGSAAYANSPAPASVATSPADSSTARRATTTWRLDQAHAQIHPSGLGRVPQQAPPPSAPPSPPATQTPLAADAMHFAPPAAAPQRPSDASYGQPDAYSAHAYSAPPMHDPVPPPSPSDLFAAALGIRPLPPLVPPPSRSVAHGHHPAPTGPHFSQASAPQARAPHPDFAPAQPPATPTAPSVASPSNAASTPNAASPSVASPSPLDLLQQFGAPIDTNTVIPFDWADAMIAPAQAPPMPLPPAPQPMAVAPVVAQPAIIPAVSAAPTAIAPAAAVAPAAVAPPVVAPLAASPPAVATPAVEQLAVAAPASVVAHAAVAAASPVATSTPVAAPAPANTPAAVASGPAASAPVASDPVVSAPVDDAKTAQIEERLERMTALRPAFAAAWEVDQFDWPKTCDELLAKSGQEFQLAAARFKAATAEGLRVLAVTSLMRREGRSTVAMSLARAAANEGVRVALVDADLDHPQLGLSVGFEATSGWSEAVTDNLPLGETAVSSVSDRLTLFPLVSGQSRRPLALNSPSVTELIDELTRCFELVIIDMGPLTGPAERGFEGGLRCPLDAAILVRDVRLTSHDQAVHAARQLRHAGVGAVGIVENFVLH